MNIKKAPAGALSSAFSAAVFKRISAVEADPSKSNQHEFNGAKVLLDLFGSEVPKKYVADFVWMSDEGEFVRDVGLLTWYDARAKHPVRSEYRLYYASNKATRKLQVGGFLVLARSHEGTIMVLMAPGSGIAEARIAYLFGIEATPQAAFAAVRLGSDQKQSLQRIFDEPEDGNVAWVPDTPSALSVDDGSVRSSVLTVQAMLSFASDPLG